jgi:hypothetical protein
MISLISMKRLITIFCILLLLLTTQVDAATKMCYGTTPVTIDINYTFTGASGTDALVQNIGNATAIKLDFTIPRGVQGESGATGAAGADGAANMTAGPPGAANMTAGPPGATGAANMTAGPPGAANMTAGPKGDPGTGATISVNYTFTLSPGASATVVNIGSSSAANLNFGIPAGAAGLNNMTMNMTANMTAGPAGTNGLNNMTANMTAGPPGANGLNNMTMNQTILDLGWNTTYAILATGRPFTGKQNFGAINISGVGEPFVSTDATTKNYVDAVNTSMLNNVSANFATKTYVDAVNTSMLNNVSNNFAQLVGGKIPTAKLGGAGGDATTYLRGDQTWASPAGGSDPTAKTTTLIYSDFYDPGVNALPGLTGLAISSGTVAVVATTANHPGVIYMRDSTTAAGGYKYGCVATQLIGGGETFEVIFQPVGIRATQHAKIGWADTAAAATQPVDGVFFNVTGTGAAISIVGNTSSNSVRSGTATSFAPTTATWYRGTITVNAGATLVTYAIYNEAGALQWTDTVSTNIPTGAGRDTAPCIIVSELTTDAAADILRLDYVRWGTTRSLTR